MPHVFIFYDGLIYVPATQEGNKIIIFTINMSGHVKVIWCSPTKSYVLDIPVNKIIITLHELIIVTKTEVLVHKNNF